MGLEPIVYQSCRILSPVCLANCTTTPLICCSKPPTKQHLQTPSIIFAVPTVHYPIRISANHIIDHFTDKYSQLPFRISIAFGKKVYLHRYLFLKVNLSHLLIYWRDEVDTVLLTHNCPIGCGCEI